MCKLSLLGILFLCISLSVGDNEETKSVVYSADSFNLGLADNNFVMFYSPKCERSQELQPVWEKLSEEFNDGDGDVVIASVDCTQEVALCSEHDVMGYPTLKFFRGGHDYGQKYTGTRTLESLKKFIQEELDKEKEGGKVSAASRGLMELSDETFDSFISSGKHFVKMYAPWCVHCKELAPIWEELAESFEYVSNVRISKLNCELYKTICKSHGVRGYPSLLWFEDGNQVTKYSGPRTHEALKAFVMERLNLEADSSTPDDTVDQPSIENPVLLISGLNFKNAVNKGVTLVKFYAPWCGFCKRMAPTWNDLAIKFLANTDVKIAKVDCTMEINTELCSQEKVEGYPTIFLYKNGEKVTEYNGNRKVEDFYNFVSDHLDSHDEL